MLVYVIRLAPWQLEQSLTRHLCAGNASTLQSPPEEEEYDSGGNQSARGAFNNDKLQ
jgi:hypothetical protein